MSRHNRISVRHSASSLRTLAHERPNKVNQTNQIWQDMHSASLLTAGRGGKGHSRATGIHAWNRKGRW